MNQDLYGRSFLMQRTEQETVQQSIQVDLLRSEELQFTTEGYFSMPPLEFTLSDHYFTHLLKYDDGRFARLGSGVPVEFQHPPVDDHGRKGFFQPLCIRHQTILAQSCHQYG